MKVNVNFFMFENLGGRVPEYVIIISPTEDEAWEKLRRRQEEQTGDDFEISVDDCQIDWTRCDLVDVI